MWNVKLIVILYCILNYHSGSKSGLDIMKLIMYPLKKVMDDKNIHVSFHKWRMIEIMSNEMFYSQQWVAKTLSEKLFLDNQ